MAVPKYPFSGISVEECSLGKDAGERVWELAHTSTVCADRQLSEFTELVFKDSVFAGMSESSRSLHCQPWTP